MTEVFLVDLRGLAMEGEEEDWSSSVALRFLTERALSGAVIIDKK